MENVSECVEHVPAQSFAPNCYRPSENELVETNSQADFDFKPVTDKLFPKAEGKEEDKNAKAVKISQEDRIAARKIIKEVFEKRCVRRAAPVPVR